MPRIEQRYIDAVFYLYASEQDAQEDARGGGTGFMVSVHEYGAMVSTIYAITNAHVINGGASVIRLNQSDGQADTIATDPQTWFRHPDGDDVALLPLAIRRSDYAVNAIPSEWLVDPPRQRNHSMESLAAGDEIFYIGRSTSLKSSQKDSVRPTVRFGNLMATWTERVRDRPLGINQESFLVEARTRVGWSGAPVFQYVPYEYSWRGHMDGLRARSRHWESREGRLVSNPVVARGEDVLQVLGVSWGYLPHRGSVYDASGQALPQYVDENTGIMCVVPASKINDLLYHQDVVVLREHQTAERSAEGDGETTAAVATTEPSEESGGAPPFTREEFIGALREVSPPKPST